MEEIAILLSELEHIESLPEAPPEVEEYLGGVICQLQNQLAIEIEKLNLPIN